MIRIRRHSILPKNMNLSMVQLNQSIELEEREREMDKIVGE